MRERIVDIRIDRQRMFEPREIGQAHFGQARAPRMRLMPASGKGTQVTIGKRQHHQFRRALAQILRLFIGV